MEAVRIRADRRGGGLGRELMRQAVERARGRGCGLVQLTSDKRRSEAHRFCGALGFARSRDGFKLTLRRGIGPASGPGSARQPTGLGPADGLRRRRRPFSEAYPSPEEELSGPSASRTADFPDEH
ncbi:GNAT family N-acetyltransferase [Streptomyces sp. NPDC057426]|uniref:GNAT family N-acetyltransferase n=1 Tax=Streptomyces sp. NPDC057426 TaxID=3346128 RepID=UPI0036B3B1BB